MNLIERYVNEVGRRLPRKEREEVQRELRSALLDAVDSPDHEPTEQQVVDALLQFGPPETVAASYRPADQYLIGPDLYPEFKRVLRLVMTIFLSLLTAVFALSFLFRPPETIGLGGRLLGFAWSLADSLPVVFAIVVLIFAGLQRLEVRPERDERSWDPRKLPAVRDEDRVGRGETAFRIVTAATFLALLFIFRDALGIVVRPGGELLLNEVLVYHLPWISMALIAGMALRVYLFWRGRWEVPTRAASVVIDWFGLAVLYRIVLAVDQQRAVLEASSLPAPLPTMILQMAWTCFAIVAAIVALETGRAAVWAVRRS